MHWFKKLILLGCFFVATVYFLGAVSAYFNTIHFKGFTFLSLAFPYLLLAICFATIVVFFTGGKKYAFFFFLIILIGYKNIFSTTAFHFPTHFNFTKTNDSNTIRLLSWNVNDFVDCQRQWDTANNNRRNILAFINKSKADIICLQDVRDYIENAGFYSNINYIKDTLGYPYFYFSQDDPYGVGYYNSAYGALIFSKFPIVDSGRIAYQWPHFPEHLQMLLWRCPIIKSCKFLIHTLDRCN
jgi:hypothetical protein